MVSKLEKAKELLRQGKSKTEVKELVPCSRATVWKAEKELEAETGRPTAPKPPEVEVEEKPVEKPEFLEGEEAEEVAEVTEKPIIPPEVLVKAVEGALEPDDVAQLFHAINDSLPEPARRPPRAMDTLGKLWCNPVNRILAKYGEENADIILASIGTIIVFAPSMIYMFKEWRMKRRIREAGKSEGEEEAT